MEQVKGYSDSREEEEEEESNSSKQQHYPSLSLSSTANYISHLPHHHHHHQSPETTESPNSSSTLGLPHHHQDATSSYFTNNHTKLHQIDFMDLSLGNKNKDEIPNVNVSIEEENLMKLPPPTEKEHMFDKVVTPSDVGKLNRLVIPKQHAEKYFPLDSTSNEKGLLLNFEDRNGKIWRFRYSYWNSSQSYVMTKGWSRFVKEKKLDAGDIVSFQRGVGEKYRHRLYIDWKRRAQNVDSSTNPFFSPFFFPPNHHPPPSIGRFYTTLPNSSHYNYNYNYHPFQTGTHHHHQQHQHQYHYGNYSSGSGSVFYLNQKQQEGRNNNVVSPMIIDSVPVVHQYHHHHNHNHNHNQHGKSSGGSGSNNSSTSQGKRLRLFGVNMECASSSSSASEDHHNVTMPNSSASHRVEATSMLFDLDPSLQYPK